MKAIIPAAGLGTRFLPTTKTVPKEMLPVLNKPVIQYAVEEALSSSFDGVVIVNSRSKKAIERYFEHDEDLVARLRKRGKDRYAADIERIEAMPVRFVYQEDPLGLGHAVCCAKDMVDDERFAVLLGDTIAPHGGILDRMVQVSDELGGASVLTVMPVSPEEVSRVGIVSGVPYGDGIIRVDSVVEKPDSEDAPSNLAIFGRYLLSPRVMHLLENTPLGAGGEIQLTDAILALLAEEPIYAIEIDPSEAFDTGTVEGWVEANRILLERSLKSGE